DALQVALAPAPPVGAEADLQGAAMGAVNPAAFVASPASAQLFARLDALLVDDDAEAAEVLAAHVSLLQAALGPAFGAFEARVAGFDFAEALVLLREAQPPPLPR
ncbi:MAG: hypothetical protein JWP29_2068, partial [Rhodoferax sp.]|nr:hypothetical protein [Rhodoferax sp.]